ncbi:unnamed protein product, partial [Prorocentrum cordatum]
PRVALSPRPCGGLAPSCAAGARGALARPRGRHAAAGLPGRAPPPGAAARPVRCPAAPVARSRWRAGPCQHRRGPAPPRLDAGWRCPASEERGGTEARRGGGPGAREADGHQPGGVLGRPGPGLRREHLLHYRR